MLARLATELLEVSAGEIGTQPAVIDELRDFVRRKRRLRGCGGDGRVARGAEKFLYAFGDAFQVAGGWLHAQIFDGWSVLPSLLGPLQCHLQKLSSGIDTLVAIRKDNHSRAGADARMMEAQMLLACSSLAILQACQRILRFRKAGLDAHGLFVVLHRLRCPAHLHQSLGQIVVRLRRIRHRL